MLKASASLLQFLLVLVQSLSTPVLGTGSDLPEDQVEEVLALYRKHCKPSYGGYGYDYDPNQGGYGFPSGGYGPSPPKVNFFCKEGREDYYEKPNKQIIKIPAEKPRKNIVFVEAPTLKVKHNINLIGSGMQNKVRVYVLPQKNSHQVKVWDKRVQGTVGKPQVFFLKNHDKSAIQGPKPSYGVPHEVTSPRPSYGPPPTHEILTTVRPSYGPPATVTAPSTTTTLRPSYGPPQEEVTTPRPSYGPPHVQTLGTVKPVDDPSITTSIPEGYPEPVYGPPVTPPAQRPEEGGYPEPLNPGYGISPSTPGFLTLIQNPSPSLPLGFDPFNLGPEYEIIPADPNAGEAYRNILSEVSSKSQFPQYQIQDYQSNAFPAPDPTGAYLSGSQLLFPSESIHNYRVQPYNPSNKHESQSGVKETEEDELSDHEAAKTIKYLIEAYEKRSSSSSSSTTVKPTTTTTPTPAPSSKPYQFRTSLLNRSFVNSLISHVRSNFTSLPSAAISSPSSTNTKVVYRYLSPSTSSTFTNSQILPYPLTPSSNSKRSVVPIIDDKPTFEIIPADFVGYSYSKVDLTN